ncbi:Unconventional myosin-Ih, partial [Frankliniella fusca]
PCEFQCSHLFLVRLTEAELCLNADFGGFSFPPSDKSSITIETRILNQIYKNSVRAILIKLRNCI